jgi:VWFA-related protein
MTKRVFLVFLLTTQLIVSALAQQPATPTPTPSPEQQQPESDEVVRITTNLVQVDAVVTDKSGKLVTDLKPDEVEILEDGRQQKITHFSFNLSQNPAPNREKSSTPPDNNAPIVPPTRIRPEDIRRTIALVVDDLGLSFESTYFVRRALKKFVDEQMQPGDLVAIIRTSGGIGALQQFTADKRQLYAAIERVKFSMGGRAGVSAFAPLEAASEGEGGAEMDAANEELNQFRSDLFTVGTLGAVTYVVRGLRDLPGRKSVLLISDGFRIRDRSDPTQTYRTVQKLQRLIDEAGRSSVVIYTMNATGLQVLGFTAADNLSGRNPEQIMEAMNNRRDAAFDTQEGMEYLAAETGGMAIKNNNDLSGGIRRVLEDQSGYYLIGYRPSESTFEAKAGRRSFHHLTLKVKRPGKFNVRMRHGFLGVSDDEKPKPLTVLQQMAGALVSPFGANGVRLQLTSLFANDPLSGPIMRSFLHLDGRDLTFTKGPDGLHTSVFDLLAITFGDNGIPIDQIGKTYTIRLGDAEYKRMLRDGLVYFVTVPIKKPGAYQLRMSLRDTASERIGSASQFIDAPDIKKNRLALSGIVLHSQARTASDSAALTNQNEGLESGSTESSAAVRRFKRGMVMSYGLFIYNARLDKASQRPQLITQVRLFRDGKEIFTGKENPYDPGQQTDMKRLAVAGGLQLGSDMTSGEYVLQVVVTDLLADKKRRTVTQWMDFQIVDLFVPRRLVDSFDYQAMRLLFARA